MQMAQSVHKKTQCKQELLIPGRVADVEIREAQAINNAHAPLKVVLAEATFLFEFLRSRRRCPIGQG